MRSIRRLSRAVIESLPQRVLLTAVFNVTTAADSGAGSLRQALVFANSNPTSENEIDIAFDSQVQTVTLLSALPAITTQVEIRGAIDQSGNPLIRIDGSHAGAGVSGLTFARNTPTNSKPSTVSGLSIVGFSGNGIDISGDAPTNVFGCRIGVGPGGKTAAPNIGDGIHISTSNCQIGLARAGAEFKTVISGNGGQGINAASGATNTIVQNCLIGTNAAGNADVGNEGSGILLDAPDALIGGRRAHQGNVISGNGDGVIIDFGNCDVLGNFIGTDITGTQAIGNDNSGIATDSVSNVSIGDSTDAGRNLISGNNLRGIGILGSGGVTVDNNLIGTDITGAKAIGNSLQGILVEDGTLNTINNCVIGGSGVDGINVIGSTAQANCSGNFIGISRDLKHAIGNGSNGVSLFTPGSFLFENTIAHNALNGVDVLQNASIANHLSDNSIFSNGHLGIKLGNDANIPLPNHSGSVAGPNDNQNYPVLASALVSGRNMTVTGTLDSLASTFFEIEFFASASADPSGFGEGQEFLGGTQVQTDGSGHASFDLNSISRPHAGKFITATATNVSSGVSDGDTSEFSQAITATGASISGTVFKDSNGNGKRDSHEDILKGRTVYVDSDKRGFFIPEVNPSAVTDSHGHYTIFGVAAGANRVRLLTTAGFRQTFPASSAAFADVNVAALGVKSGVNFGQQKSTAAPATLAIDAGSTEPYIDLNGQTFDPDFKNIDGDSGFDVKGTDDDALFYVFVESQTINYSIAVPNGKYQLKLFFVDPVSSAAGQRTFNVIADGKRLLKNFDIFAKANAPKKAVVTTTGSFTVSNKKLDLAFTGVVGDAIISALELIPS